VVRRSRIMIFEEFLAGKDLIKRDMISSYSQDNYDKLRTYNDNRASPNC